MQQENLFFDGPREAIKHLVRALGGAKKVGPILRPGKPLQEAATWLSNAIDGDRREQLHIEDIMQLIQLGRAHDCHCLINELCRGGAYADPPLLEPEDEEQKLQRQYIEAVRLMKSITERQEQLASTRANLRAAR